MKSKIKEVQQRADFPGLEDRITKLWKEGDIFKKSVEQRSIDNSYSFVDGPPFVTGVPHYGSLLPSIAKDVVPRFWTMKGKRVRRVFGWDCHGIPIEEKVNEKFGIRSSAQLEEEMGIEKYVQECRNWVKSCTDDWRWYIEKIGRWVDMDNAYYTMDPNYMESVIWAFKQMYEKGFVYKGKRVSLFSTDTSTPVSNFEVAMDTDNYKDTDDISIFVKFKLNPKEVNKLFDLKLKNVDILAWTTTPWTIASNFALAVNPKYDYCLVEFEENNYILSKARLAYTFDTTEENIGIEKDKLVRILKEFKGNELDGLSYTPVYDFFVGETTDKDFKIYLYDGVTIEEGTGVLHIAPAFGEEDFMLGKKFGISAIADIDEAGKMVVGEWKGMYLRKACEPITQNLSEKGNLLRSLVYNHRLPYYRGKNPLIYMAQDSYFIDVQKIKARMLELNKNINWVPDFIKEGRFAQTIETSPDWAISRSRYWATIMPVWENEDGDQIVVGSFEEMMQYTDQITKKEVKGKTVYEFAGEPMDLHRDVCDKIVFTKNGKKYHRIPEVLDCWMDSGSVPFAEHHYPFENKKHFEEAFPADYIIEYVGQVRAWFNVLLRVSTMLFDNNAFTNVICTGVLAGNDGRKMSKSFGNFPDPKEVLNKIGAEALRLYLMGSPIMVGGDMSWSDELLNEQVKNVLIPLWNTYRYLSLYAQMHDWTPKDTEFTTNNILDTWLKNYMDKVTVEYSKALEAYNIPASVKLIQPCIDNISTWWIRRSRDRFVSGDKDALQNLYAALVRFAKTFAPQMPFIAEEMYQTLVVDTGIKGVKESVHLEDYPEVDEKSLNEELLTRMDQVRIVCSLGLKIRDDNKIKLRQPLSKVYVNFEDKELFDILKAELNVKEVVHTDKFPTGKKLVEMSEGENKVVLDIELTEELLMEGLYREVVRTIQNARKETGLTVGEKVNVVMHSTDEKLKKAVDKNMESFVTDVSASDFKWSTKALANEAKVGDSMVSYELTK